LAAVGFLQGVRTATLPERLCTLHACAVTRRVRILCSHVQGLQAGGVAATLPRQRADGRKYQAHTCMLRRPTAAFLDAAAASPASPCCCCCGLCWFYCSFQMHAISHAGPTLAVAAAAAAVAVAAVLVRCVSSLRIHVARFRCCCSCRCCCCPASAPLHVHATPPPTAADSITGGFLLLAVAAVCCCCRRRFLSFAPAYNKWKYTKNERNGTHF